MFQAFQYIDDVVHIVLGSGWVDDYIVKVDEVRFTFIFSEYDARGSLKELGGARYTEKHADVLVGAGVRENAVFGRTSSRMCLCRYPENTSSAEKILVCPR